MARAGLSRPVLPVLLALFKLGSTPVFAKEQAVVESACRKALIGRIKVCADDCLARARAAVAPEIRDRIKGYGCVNNCSKLEMFNNHSCPDL